FEMEDYFVASTFCPGSKLLRTGDVGCCRVDGRLEISDTRGRYTWMGEHSIAPDEVEAALLQEPSVKECAVLALEVSDLEKHFVAYVVSTGSWEPDGFHRHLQDILPPFMLPVAYVPVTSLPLNHSGEIDRQALARIQ